MLLAFFLERVFFDASFFLDLGSVCYLARGSTFGNRGRVVLGIVISDVQVLNVHKIVDHVIFFWGLAEFRVGPRTFQFVSGTFGFISVLVRFFGVVIKQVIR